MKCLSELEWRELLGRRGDSADSPDPERHLEECAGCRAIVDRLVGEWEPPRSPEPESRLPSAVRQRLEAHPPESLPDTEPFTSRSPLEFPEPPTEFGPLGKFGCYHIMQVLGQGGFGQVFRARHDRLPREVAIKVLTPSFRLRGGVKEWPERCRRFLTEAETEARLECEHVVRVYDFGKFQSPSWPGYDLPYLEMELVNGRTLSEEIRDNTSIPIRQAAEWARQIAVGLAAAHAANVVHRDIKPANILLAHPAAAVGDGSGLGSHSGQKSSRAPVAKISDFGLALWEDSGERLTVEGQFLGTPGYASPEQYVRHGIADARSDIYSLGAVLYEMLTRARPVTGKFEEISRWIQLHDPVAPNKLNPSVPLDLATITMKCLRREQSGRYATAVELAEDLGRFLEGQPIRARPVGLATRAWLAGRRRPLVVSLSGLLLVAVVAGGALVFHQWRRAERGWSQATSEQRRADRNYQRVYDAFLEAAQAQQLIADRSDSIASRLEAKKAAQRVISILENLLGENPERIELREALATGLTSLADSERNLGERDAALQTTIRALAAWEWLAARHPARHQYPYEVANCQFQIATSAGSGAERLRELERLNERLASPDSPARGAAQFEVLRARVCGGIGATLDNDGREAAAVEQYRQAIAALERHLKRTPDDRSAGLYLVSMWNNLAIAAKAVGTPTDAIQHYLQARKIVADLERQFPNNRDVLDSAGRICNNLGKALDAAGKPDEAIAEYRAAVALREQVHRGDPTDMPVVAALANNYVQLGRALIRHGQVADGLGLYVRARDLVEPAATLFPSDPTLRRRLAHIYSDWASEQVRIGQVAEAEGAYRRGIAAYQQLVADDPNDDDLVSMLAANYGNLAQLADLRGDRSACRDLLAKSRALWVRLVEKTPHDVQHRLNLINSLIVQSDLDVEENDLAKASANLATADEQLASCLKRWPQNPSLLGTRISIHRKQSRLALDRLGQPPVAVALAQAAAAEATALLAQSPSDASLQFLSGACRHELGMALAANRQDAEALAAFVLADAQLLEVVRTAGEVVDHRDMALLHLREFAEYQRTKQRRPEAVVLLKQRAELTQSDPAELLVAAQAVADCIADLPPQPDSEPFRAEWTSMAVDWLAAAVRQGFPPDRLVQDPRLASLRPDPRFLGLHSHPRLPPLFLFPVVLP